MFVNTAKTSSGYCFQRTRSGKKLSLYIFFQGMILPLNIYRQAIILSLNVLFLWKSQLCMLIQTAHCCIISVIVYKESLKTKQISNVQINNNLRNFLWSLKINLLLI